MPINLKINLEKIFFNITKLFVFVFSLMQVHTHVLGIWIFSSVNAKILTWQISKSCEKCPETYEILNKRWFPLEHVPEILATFSFFQSSLTDSRTWKNEDISSYDRSVDIILIFIIPEPGARICQWRLNFWYSWSCLKYRAIGLLLAKTGATRSKWL